MTKCFLKLSRGLQRDIQSTLSEERSRCLSCERAWIGHEFGLGNVPGLLPFINIESKIIETPKVSLVGNELPSFELFQGDLDVHQIVASLRLREPGAELENLRKRINRIHIRNNFVMVLFGIGRPVIRKILPLSGHREVVDEKAIGMKPPNLKVVILFDVFDVLLDPVTVCSINLTQRSAERGGNSGTGPWASRPPIASASVRSC